MNQLLEETKTTRVVNATVAGTGDVNGTVLDMAGFDGVLFIAAVGMLTVNNVTTLKAQQDTVQGFGGGADLEGTEVAITDADDDQLIMLDVFRPVEQFVRCVVTRTTANAVVDSVIAIQYSVRDLATTQDATTVAASEKHVSPAEGTA